MMPWYAQAIVTFAVMAALDYVWAYYQRAVTLKNPMRAGQLSAAIIVLNSVVVLSYADSHWMIAPAAAGAFFGTYISVGRH